MGEEDLGAAAVVLVVLAEPVVVNLATGELQLFLRGERAVSVEVVVVLLVLKERSTLEVEEIFFLVLIVSIPF